MTREAAAGLAAAPLIVPPAPARLFPDQTCSPLLAPRGLVCPSPSGVPERARAAGGAGLGAGTGAGRGWLNPLPAGAEAVSKAEGRRFEPCRPCPLLRQNGCKFIVPAAQMLVFRFGVLLPVRRVDYGELLGRHAELEQSVRLSPLNPPPLPPPPIPSTSSPPDHRDLLHLSPSSPSPISPLPPPPPSGGRRLPWCPLRSRRNCTGVKVRGKPVTRSRVLTLGAASQYADCSAVPNGTRARRRNDK